MPVNQQQYNVKEGNVDLDFINSLKYFWRSEK